MKALCVISIGMLLAPGAAGAGITVSLEVADVQDEALLPYRTAELSIDNAAAAAIETVVLRPAGGGPAMRAAFAAPPAQKSTREVALPAIWPVQEYTVTALDAAGAEVGTASAGITWPPDLVATDQFVDDAFAPFRDAPVTFPARTRRNAILLLAIFATAAAGTLFIRRPSLRAAAIGIATAGATGLAFCVPAWPEAVEATDYHLELWRGRERLRADSFTVLAARRTGRIQRKARRVPFPVYPDRRAALEDSAEVTPADRTITLTVRRGEVRVLRPAGDRPRGTDIAFIDSAVREIKGIPHVSAGFPYRPGFVVRNDSLWSLSARSGEIPLRPEESRSVWEIVSDPGRHKLAREHARLFAYWRDKKYQRAGTFYLLGFSGRGGHFALVVVEMQPATTTRPGEKRAGETSTSPAAGAGTPGRLSGRRPHPSAPASEPSSSNPSIGGASSGLSRRPASVQASS